MLSLVIGEVGHADVFVEVRVVLDCPVGVEGVEDSV